MTENATFRPLLTSKNGDVYEYLGDKRYTNLTSQRSVKLSDEEAAKVFTVPVHLNIVSEMNGNLVSLIEKLGLKYGGSFIYKGDLKLGGMLLKTDDVEANLATNRTLH